MQRLLSAQFLWLAARLAGAGAGLVFQLCLARTMTPHDLGVFFSASSLAAILGIISSQGYPSIAARFISRYSQRRQPACLAQFFALCRRDILSCSLVVGAVVVAAAIAWPHSDSNTRLSFILAGLCVPAMAIVTALVALGVAQRRFLAALIPDLFLRPVLLALGAGIALLLHIDLVGSEAMLGFAVVVIGLAGFQLAFLKPPRTRIDGPIRPARLWRREAWMLLAVMLFTSFFGDLAIVCATPFTAPSDLAALGLTIKIAMIVGFGVQIAHQILLPDLSDAYARHQPKDSMPVLIKGAIFPIAFSATALGLTALLDKPILRLFGPQFEHASGPLLLLVGCQFVRALGGPSQNVLTLEGRQMSNLTICLLSSLVLMAGNLVLSKPFGLWGAAISAAAAYLFWVIASGWMLLRKGKVQTDLFSIAIGTWSARPVAQRI